MTAASNSEARKRAQQAASASESPLSRPIGPEAGPSQSDWQIDPQAICQCGANGWHICPNAAPVDSGAIGRLNEAERAEVERHFGWVPEPEPLDQMLTLVERIVREHTDRALAEVEQRIAGWRAAFLPSRNLDPAWIAGWRSAVDYVTNSVRAARQERGR